MHSSRPSRRQILAAALAAAALLTPLASGPARAQDPAVVEGPTTPLRVETGTGVYPFFVEVADDTAERSRGLMYRRSLPPDRGMLFDMGETREAAFWMENTYVSLDILFIGENGRVVSITTDTTPLSKALIPSNGDVRYVLELVAGTVRRIGAAPGDRVRHAIIPSG
jgi:uncharacterized membrane protein (UPF0127 family)